MRIRKGKCIIMEITVEVVFLVLSNTINFKMLLSPKSLSSLQETSFSGIQKLTLQQVICN